MQVLKCNYITLTMYAVVWLLLGKVFAVRKQEFLRRDIGNKREIKSNDKTNLEEPGGIKNTARFSLRRIQEENNLSNLTGQCEDLSEFFCSMILADGVKTCSKVIMEKKIHEHCPKSCGLCISDTNDTISQMDNTIPWIHEDHDTLPEDIYNGQVNQVTTSKKNFVSINLTLAIGIITSIVTVLVVVAIYVKFSMSNRKIIRIMHKNVDTDEEIEVSLGKRTTTQTSISTILFLSDLDDSNSGNTNSENTSGDVTNEVLNDIKNTPDSGNEGKVQKTNSFTSTSDNQFDVDFVNTDDSDTSKAICDEDSGSSSLYDAVDRYNSFSLVIKELPSNPFTSKTQTSAKNCEETPGEVYLNKNLDTAQSFASRIFNVLTSDMNRPMNNSNNSLTSSIDASSLISSRSIGGNSLLNSFFTGSHINDSGFSKQSAVQRSTSTGGIHSILSEVRSVISFKNKYADTRDMDSFLERLPKENSRSKDEIKDPYQLLFGCGKIVCYLPANEDNKLKPNDDQDSDFGIDTLCCKGNQLIMEIDNNEIKFGSFSLDNYTNDRKSNWEAPRKIIQKEINNETSNLSETSEQQMRNRISEVQRNVEMRGEKKINYVEDEVRGVEDEMSVGKKNLIVQPITNESYKRTDTDISPKHIKLRKSLSCYVNKPIQMLKRNKSDIQEKWKEEKSLSDPDEKSEDIRPTDSTLEKDTNIQERKTTEINQHQRSKSKPTHHLHISSQNRNKISDAYEGEQRLLHNSSEKHQDRITKIQQRKTTEINQHQKSKSKTTHHLHSSSQNKNKISGVYEGEQKLIHNSSEKHQDCITKIQQRKTNEINQHQQSKSKSIHHPQISPQNKSKISGACEGKQRLLRTSSEKHQEHIIPAAQDRRVRSGRSQKMLIADTYHDQSRYSQDWPSIMSQTSKLKKATKKYSDRERNGRPSLEDALRNSEGNKISDVISSQFL